MLGEAGGVGLDPKYEANIFDVAEVSFGGGNGEDADSGNGLDVNEKADVAGAEDAGGRVPNPEKRGAGVGVSGTLPLVTVAGDAEGVLPPRFGMPRITLPLSVFSSARLKPVCPLLSSSSSSERESLVS